MFDYVVVGAGSAGSIVAARLSESGKHSVLLLEAGGTDAHWQIRIPAAVRENVKPTSPHNWHYVSEPEPFLDHRRMPHPRGKVIGGSGSLNGMVFLRGHPLDYERWAQEGARGWSYRAVLPYFKRMESREDGGDDYRGDAGPIRVRKQHDLSPLPRAFLEAGRELGYPFTDDVNGYRQEGFCRFDMNIQRGVRASSAYAHLRPARARRNLRVETLCHATRVLFDGRRAVGVEYLQHGEPREARAAREVVLCGGAIGSPQLLLLSGIGPAASLAALGIEVLADRPGVGENLQDHLEVHLRHECPDPVSLNRIMTPLGKLRVGLQWLLTRTGPAAVNHSQVGAFLTLSPDAAHPDTQIHFWPVIMDGWEIPTDRFGFSMAIGPMRPTSRGTLTLRSPEPGEHPRLRFNYCETEGDRIALRRCLPALREIAGSGAFARYRSREVWPGPAVRSDDEVDAWVRESATTAWHPMGTCRMGDPERVETVVDPDGRVVGVERLRVVDASTIPSMASSNLNAVVMMMAEKLSDAILGREPPAPEDVPIYGGYGYS